MKYIYIQLNNDYITNEKDQLQLIERKVEAEVAISQNKLL